MDHHYQKLKLCCLMRLWSKFFSLILPTKIMLEMGRDSLTLRHFCPGSSCGRQCRLFELSVRRCCNSKEQFILLRIWKLKEPSFLNIAQLVCMTTSLYFYYFLSVHSFSKGVWSSVWTRMEHVHYTRIASRTNGKGVRCSNCLWFCCYKQIV